MQKQAEEEKWCKKKGERKRRKGKKERGDKEMK